METKRIIIKVQERKTSNGKSFNTYKAVTKNGRLIDAKFRKEVKELPTGDCYAVIGVDNMNVDKNKEYPVLWISAVEGYETLGEVASENNKKQLDDMFE